MAHVTNGRSKVEEQDDNRCAGVQRSEDPQVCDVSRRSFHEWAGSSHTRAYPGWDPLLERRSSLEAFSNITEGLPDHGCGGDALGELMGGNWMRIVETCSGLSNGPPHCVARIAGEET